MQEIPKDCLSCANSGINDDDELWCVVKQEVVPENDTCEDYN
jgi:hypothetical protein